jgi:DNA-directed RNA polymerase specialized sigma24 family protein
MLGMQLKEVISVADRVARKAARRMSYDSSDDLEQVARLACWRWWKAERGNVGPTGVGLVAYRATVDHIRSVAGRSGRPRLVHLAMRELQQLSKELPENHSEALDGIIGRMPGKSGEVLTMMRKGFKSLHISQQLGVSERTALRYMAEAVRQARILARNYHV